MSEKESNTIRYLDSVIVNKDQRIEELEAKVERLENAIQHCDPLCPAWAALEGKQDGDK